MATARKEIVLLALAVGVGLALRLGFFTGLIANDDLTHAHAAYHLFDDPGEHIFAGEGPDAGNVNERRIGVNLPMWLSLRLFGTSEWSFALVPLLFSLTGIVVMFALVRRLAGANAGLLAAWLWACLPADVYSATIFLQDNIFATVLAIALYFAVASEPAAATCREPDDPDRVASGDPRTRTRQMAAAAGAGFAVGYAQYLKGNGFIVLSAFVAWLAWTSLRARRIDRRLPWLIGGFVAAQALAAVYFWAAMGDPLHFWRMQFSRLAVLTGSYQAPHPFPGNVFVMWRYVTEDWVLGYAAVAFPVLAAAALASRETPLRSLWVSLSGAQLVAMLGAMSWGNWTQRYMLQITVPFLVLAVLGARALARHAARTDILAHHAARIGVLDRALGHLRSSGKLPAPATLARVAVTAAAIALVAATAGALAGDRQQLGRDRAKVVRDAYTYLSATAGEREPIYVEESANLPRYTRRALALLAGYQPFKGGFRPVDEAYQATEGWVVLTHFEQRRLRRPGGAAPREVADHWLEVFRSQNRRGSYFARVFRVLPEPVPDGVTVVHTYLFPARSPDLEGLSLVPVTFEEPPERYRSRRERGVAAVDIAVGAAREHPADGGERELTCRVTADASPGRHRGGVTVDVAGMAALRFHLRFSDPRDIEAFVIYAENRSAKRIARWRLALRRSQWEQGWEGEVALVPGAPSGYFKLAGDEIAPAEIARLQFLLRVRAGRAAGFTLRGLEIAAP